MSIGENIKRLRTEHGMSQSEFGAIAGVTDKAVSTWENGAKEPRMGAIQKIADYFNIRKSEIIEDCPPIGGDVQPSELTEFLTLFRKLTSDEKKMLIAQMRGLTAGR